MFHGSVRGSLMSSLLLLYYSGGRKGTNFPGILITGPPCSFSKDEVSSPHVSHSFAPVFWSRNVYQVPADYKDRFLVDIQIQCKQHWLSSTASSLLCKDVSAMFMDVLQVACIKIRWRSSASLALSNWLYSFVKGKIKMSRNPHISHQILSTVMQTTELDKAVPFLAGIYLWF